MKIEISLLRGDGHAESKAQGKILSSVIIQGGRQILKRITICAGIAFIALSTAPLSAQETSVDQAARDAAAVAQGNAAQAQHGVSAVSGGLVAVQQQLSDLQAQVDALPPPPGT